MPRKAFLFRTDVHLADKGPVSWKGDYPAEIWSSLEQIGQLAKRYEVSAVLDGGDFFHIKTASKTSHASVIRTAALHKTYPCPTFCVEGNHDMPYNNLELIERQPLGVLYGCGVFEHLRDQVFQDGDLRVRVVGVPYNPKRTLDQLKTVQKQPGDDFLVCIVHALATENPPSKLDDFFGETVFRYSDLVTPDGPDVWAFGHWHRDQGVMQVGGKWFVNQGAVSRGALTHENVMRTPQVALIEFEATGPIIQTIPLIVAPASEVFDMERKERADAELNKIEDFILLLHNDSSFDSEQSAEDNIRAMQDVASDVRDLALEYLANAREG